MEKIYIQIPAYRDSELVPTIINILETADHSSRLRIGICWQHSINEVLPGFFINHANIEVIDVNYTQSNGCNWARRQLQKKWNNEEYTLLLDSHHRFIQGWDTSLIEMYKSLKNDGVQKPLITGYLPPYDPEIDPSGRQPDPLKIFGLSRERGLLIYLTSYPIPLWQWLKKPVRASFASLHFIFTEGNFNNEILFDDEVYFFGDEVLIGLRAFTYGYDLFHPHYVIGWHLYERDKTRITHWTDHGDSDKRHQKSHQKLRDIFLGVDSNCLGNIRTIAEYEYLINDKLIRS